LIIHKTDSFADFFLYIIAHFASKNNRFRKIYRKNFSADALVGLCSVEKCKSLHPELSFFLAKMRKMKKHPSNFAKTIDNFMQNGYNKDTILFIRRLEEF